MKNQYFVRNAQKKKMDKILELTINELIKRVELLEREVIELKGKSNYNYPKEASKTDEASEKQIKFLQDLNIPIPEGLTRYEAKLLIQETLNKKNYQKPVSPEDNEKLSKENDQDTEDFPDY